VTVAFRRADFSNEPERHFIVDSWVSSYRYSDTSGMIAPENWFRVMIPEVERVLDRPDAITIVAYEPGDTSRLSDIQGFITVDTTEQIPVVFYCFVKEAYRRSGYARGLFNAAGIDPARPFFYTCTTEIVSRIRRDNTRLQLARYAAPIARFRKDDPRRPRRFR
jgi:hypothetical protein